MYNTPLKSRVDKSKVSYLLSLLINSSEKIKFAFCTDLLIENSLFNEKNEHYFHDEYLIEFWTNYNNNRKYLYHTIQKHLKMNREIIQTCIDKLELSDPINRSSLIFLSNNLSENNLYGSKIVKNPDMEDLPNVFTRTNKITAFKTIDEFEIDDSITILECLSSVSYAKDIHKYFTNIIQKTKDIYVLTDIDNIKKQFQKHIHINDQYYLCYEKESK